MSEKDLSGYAALLSSCIFCNPYIQQLFYFTDHWCSNSQLSHSQLCSSHRRWSFKGCKSFILDWKVRLPVVFSKLTHQSENSLILVLKAKFHFNVMIPSPWQSGFHIKNIHTTYLRVFWFEIPHSAHITAFVHIFL